MSFSARRSTTYRAEFFKTHKPAISGVWFCAYCGRPVSRNKITVDHLYPVNRARHSWWLRHKLKSRGYADINDPRNLVPACKTCNKRKSDKVTKALLIKGRLGSIQWLWIPRNILRIILLITFTAYVLTFIGEYL